MKVDQYRRPQAPASVGNIYRANEIIRQKNLEKSFERRYARFEELDLIWKPQDVQQTNESNNGPEFFSHLIPEVATNPLLELKDPIHITWRKFYETVIPNAKSIKYLIGAEPNNYTSIVTACHIDAPPILQWDNEDKRNPFSYYCHREGMYHSWNLYVHRLHEITGICFMPHMWYGGNYPHHGLGVVFILKEAKDLTYNTTMVGNGLFPEILRSDLHEIRSTIEAYSNTARFEGYEESSASGIIFANGDYEWNAIVRVETELGAVTYKLDRWD